MARQSLLALLMSLPCAGCLVADPPLADVPGRSPPVLLLNQAKPPITQIIQLDDRYQEKSYVDFSVPLRSEDRNDDVQLNFHVDYRFDVPSRTFIGARQLKASTLDDLGRVSTFHLDTASYFGTDRRGPGCHQLTVIVCHTSSLTEDLNDCDPQKGLQDTAMATWWINYDAPDGDPSNLGNCPTLNTPQQ